MARPLNKEVIKKRIKENTILMKSNKKFVTEQMAKMVKGDTDYSARDIRESLSKFIKSVDAVNSDILKLKQAEGK